METKKQKATEAANVEAVAQANAQANENVTQEAAPVEAAPVEAVNYATLMGRGIKLPLDTSIIDAGGLVVVLHDAGRAIVGGEEKHQLFSVSLGGNVVAVDGAAMKFTSPEVKAMLQASDYTISTARASRKGVATISELTDAVIKQRYTAACEKYNDLLHAYVNKLLSLTDYVKKVLGVDQAALFDTALDADGRNYTQPNYILPFELFAAELRRKYEETAAAKAERKAAQKRVETAAAVAASDDATKRETLIATLRSCGCDVQTINTSLAAAGFAPIEA